VVILSVLNVRKLEIKKSLESYQTVFLICPFMIIQKQSLTTRNKKRNRYKHTIDRFKVVADKDMRKMSNIVENLIRRYVESRV